jgi:hypothetical protein
MRFRVRGAALVVLILVTLTVTACDNPPEKEILLAQGALEAARAAGAEQYATEDFQGAVRALQQSREAVTQRDYRLALNCALDSLERAQTAARTAADGKAVVRSQAELGIRDLSALLVDARAHIKAAEAARIPPRALAGAEHAIGAADQSLQEARTALAKEAYVDARKALSGTDVSLRDVIRQIDELLAPKPRPRRR